MLYNGIALYYCIHRGIFVCHTYLYTPTLHTTKMAAMWDGKQKVREKLKKHPDYVNSADKEISALAEDLCQVEKTRQVYFDSMIHCQADIAAEAFEEDDGDTLLHSLEMEKQKQRDCFHIANVCDLSIKLHLVQLKKKVPLAGTFSSLLGCEYGPYHAGLIVDEVVLEWNDSSLVIPRGSTMNTGSVYQENVSKRSRLVAVADEKIKDVSSKKHDIENKFQVLWSAATAKAKVIDELVKVIVQYNTQKQYSVFGCNCQHFVSDAMKALEIREPPTFSGKLGEYFQKLKKHQKIPKHFPTHEDLDIYVAANLERNKISEDEKEYLLCVYFQFHLSTVDDIEICQCPKVSCRMDQLELSIDVGSSLFNRVLKHQPLEPVSQECRQTVHQVPVSRMIVPARHSAVRPRYHSSRALHPMEASRAVKQLCSQPGELVHGTPPLTLEDQLAILQVNEDIADQRSALEKFSSQGFKHQVMEKLRKSTQQDQHAHDFSEVLSEHESLRAKYFSGLIEGVSKPAVLEATERRHNAETASKNLSRVCKFSVRLVFQVRDCSSRSLSEIMNLPLHTLAALQIGNIFLKWNEQGLVIPCFQDTRPRLKNDLNAESQWKTFVAQKQPAISSAVEELDRAKQVDVMYDLTTKKDRLLHSLIAVIVKYNRSKEYNRLRCNNSHFISDALRALEVRCLTDLNSTLQQYMYRQKKNRSDTIPNEFKSHYNLDTYVFENVDVCQLGQADVDHLLGQYFHFHCGDWISSGKSMEWSCKEDSCQMHLLEN